MSKCVYELLVTDFNGALCENIIYICSVFPIHGCMTTHTGQEKAKQSLNGCSMPRPWQEYTKLLELLQSSTFAWSSN